MCKTITRIEDSAEEIDCDFKKPEGVERFIAKFPQHQFRFEHAHLILSFNKSYLINTLVHADPMARQLVIKPCEAKLSALGRQHGIAMRVRDILSHAQPHYLSIEAVAERLHVSDRTLKRQLAAEGTSFSALVDELRYRHATSLLSRTDFTLEQIADQLGYSDGANFSRAFKRWSGRSPSNWRKDPY